MRSFHRNKCRGFTGILLFMLLCTGTQSATAQDPWETPEGQACFEQWIREAMGRINTYQGGDEFNARKPWSINRYGILEGNPKYGPTSVSAPDDFNQYKNKYHYMWNYWHIPSGVWPRPKMKDFYESGVPHIRDYVLECISGSQQQPPPVWGGDTPPNQTGGDAGWVVNRVWQFGRGDGSVIAKWIRLLPGGKIQGYSHPNESRWGLENNQVVFYHSNGKPSCRFTSVRTELGKLILSGPYLFNQRFTHVLREMGSQQQPPPVWGGDTPPTQTGGDAGWVVNRVWQFGRGDGSVIAKWIRLLPGGKIQGYSHPNESRWGLENNQVVFYHSNGKPSCRFTSVRTELGKLILSGPYLFNQRFTHVLREMGSQQQPPPVWGRDTPPTQTGGDAGWVVDRVWQFGRGDGSVIAKRIRLLPGGKIQGYSHSNESRWGLENNQVVFYHGNGKPSCRFTTVRTEQGKLVLSGPFLFNKQFTHVLKEVGEKP